MASSRWLVGAACVVPAAVVTIAGVLRYWDGSASSDLAILDQAAWLISRGDPPFISIIQESFLADHFSPAVYLLAPFYLVAASPVWLIVLQGAAVAVVALLITARLQALPTGRRGAIAVVMVLTPAVMFGLLKDVHLFVLGLPLALLAVFRAQDARYLPAALFGLAAATFRIELGIVAVIALVVAPGEWTLKRFVALAPVAVYVGAAITIESAMGHADLWDAHYAHIGDSPSDALTHPWRILLALLDPWSILKLAFWSASCAFLCWFRPRWVLPAMGMGIYVLLSSWHVTYTPRAHYHLGPTLLLAPAWTSYLSARPERARLIPIANLALIAALAVPAVPALTQMMAGDPTGAREIADLIPEDAAVSATNEALTSLSRRERIYYWPYPFRAGPADYLDTTARSDPALAAEVDYIVVPRGTEGIPLGFKAFAARHDFVAYRRDGM